MKKLRSAAKAAKVRRVSDGKPDPLCSPRLQKAKAAAALAMPPPGAKGKSSANAPEPSRKLNGLERNPPGKCDATVTVDHRNAL